MAGGNWQQQAISDEQAASEQRAGDERATSGIRDEFQGPVDQRISRARRIRDESDELGDELRAEENQPKTSRTTEPRRICDELPPLIGNGNEPATSLSGCNPP